MLATLLATITALVPASRADAAPPTVTYDAIYATLPGNVASTGFEAYAANELGDEITFAAGTGRKLNVVTATMSSWACQSGAWFSNDCSTTPGSKSTVPITFSIYRESHAGPDSTMVPGKLIARVTKPFAIPYRPSANFTKCNGANAGKWWSAADATCYNGKAVNISLNFSTLGLTLPDTVVVTLAYDTTHYGYDPIGESAPCYTASGGCFYDSLNIGTDGTAPTLGTNPDAGTIFQAAAAGLLCDATPTPGVLNLDSPTTPCWAGYVPNFRITTH